MSDHSRQQEPRCRVSPLLKDERANGGGDVIAERRDCEAGTTCAVLRLADVMPAIANARISTQTAYFDWTGTLRTRLGLRQLRFAYYARPGRVLHLHNVRDKCAVSSVRVVVLRLVPSDLLSRCVASRRVAEYMRQIIGWRLRSFRFHYNAIADRYVRIYARSAPSRTRAALYVRE